MSSEELLETYAALQGAPRGGAGPASTKLRVAPSYPTVNRAILQAIPPQGLSSKELVAAVMSLVKPGTPEGTVRTEISRLTGQGVLRQLPAGRPGAKRGGLYVLAKTG